MSGEYELKPCPFCGGPAKHNIDHTTEQINSVACVKCNFYISDDAAVNSCVDRWNHRNGTNLARLGIDKSALAAAVRKTARLRIEDVGGRKERPAETVKSCLNRGYNSLGSDDGLSYILKHAIGYYLAAEDLRR